ncbi:exonuclease domain-containing protein [Neobacillus ginsengisoli]|uniref:DNA polymerase-3 subunit epsilon n=1 Tax=Neobacillus ginsengisoli TaxID=904295 RepID=A0ABT9XYU0_9BACI|nr:exonuclease domain-containing protein [Neobacillus ginsengisoli]MDQ0200533.1 DNA polymerase-3 subunit epsilon [Neobacillus ginsengisoli]
MGMIEMIQFLRQMYGKIGSNIYAGVGGQSNLQQISFMRQLQKEMKEKDVLDSPLNELRVVVFDIETTGFYPEKGDQVLSIGAIKMTGHQVHIDDTFYSLIHSELPLSDAISSLTNIQEEQLRTAPEAKEVLIQFFKYVHSDILVAHHAKHEQSFMQRMTWDIMRTRFEHRIIDTSFLIRLSNPTKRSLPLEEICEECGIEIKDRHHALGDAVMTASIWSCYLQKALTMGFKNLREVYEYLAHLK